MTIQVRARMMRITCAASAFLMTRWMTSKTTRRKTVVEYATTVAGEQLDDVILAYMKFAGPPPEYTGPVHFTLRQRIRIRKNRLNHAVQQWIHDHLPEAYCDN